MPVEEKQEIKKGKGAKRKRGDEQEIELKSLPDLSKSVEALTKAGLGISPKKAVDGVMKKLKDTMGIKIKISSKSKSKRAEYPDYLDLKEGDDERDIVTIKLDLLLDNIEELKKLKDEQSQYRLFYAYVLAGITVVDSDNKGKHLSSAKEMMDEKLKAQFPEKFSEIKNSLERLIKIGGHAPQRGALPTLQLNSV